MREILFCAFRSLCRQRTRSILTVSGILVGMFLVALISVINSAGSAAINGELENMGLSGLSVKAADSSSLLTDAELETIRALNEVESALPLTIQISASILRDHTEETVICGLDAGSNQVIALELLHGRQLTAGDVRVSRMVCVVDEAVAQAGYQRDNVVGKSIGLLFDGREYVFEIVGVTKTGSSLLQNLTAYIPGMVYVPYTTMQQLTGKTDFDQVTVRVREGEDAARVGEQILTALARGRSGSAYATENMAAQRDRLNSVLNIVTMVLTAIGAVSLLVSGLGILTAMLISVGERTREIGIKKAIGATRIRILSEFLVEAVLLTTIGGVLGMALGYSVGYGALAMLGMSAPAPSISPLWLLVFAIAAGAAFGAYPAFKAASLRPVEALRRD